ncbi:MAG: hypothetical protein U9P90_04260 [Patescibacteria group bacterium]|nr:hypothetical protein [Patescibacteria group bacterium]
MIESSRTPDDALFTVDDFVELGHSKGVTKQDWLQAVDRKYEEVSVAQIIHSNPHLQHILKKLQELNLPVPTNLTVPVKPDFIPEKCAHLIYEFPRSVVSDEKLLDAVVVNGHKIKEYAKLKDMRDIVDTPKQARFVWVNDGRNRLDVSPLNAEKSFVQGEIGGTVRAGLHLLLYYPEILNHHLLDLPGSRYDVDIPYLSGWDGRPRLDAYSADDAVPEGGSVSLGVSQ